MIILHQDNCAITQHTFCEVVCESLDPVKNKMADVIKKQTESDLLNAFDEWKTRLYPCESANGDGMLSFRLNVGMLDGLNH